MLYACIWRCAMWFCVKFRVLLLWQRCMLQELC
jgi:hypothetical protein